MWFLVTFVFAFILNFTLPRLMPGDPVAGIVSHMAQGMTNTSGIQAIYKQYADLFGTNRPIIEQFFIYVGNVFKGDFGFSFSQYPRKVMDVIGASIWWSVALQLPAIIIGWFIGNILGALAAYIRKGFDKALLPISIFISNLPPFGMAILLLAIFGVGLKWLPTSGGYGFDLIPNLSLSFLWSVFVHYQMPFWSVVMIAIGGQAIGMRSMSIYELNADYVKYARFLGIKDRTIVGYVFRNAMLPQLTGLSLSLGTMIGGNLIAEIIFSYPGLGFTLLNGVTGGDYPLISASTMLVSIMVLVATFLVEILYGVIDPRIKAAQSD
jgi:peptide/nickel transport system permease protein